MCISQRFLQPGKNKNKKILVKYSQVGGKNGIKGVNVWLQAKILQGILFSHQQKSTWGACSCKHKTIWVLRGLLLV